MVGHDYVGIECEAGGLSGFIESVASYDLDGVGTENRHAVFGYRGYVESWRISRNGMHEA
jgi:hypothetical protein